MFTLYLFLYFNLFYFVLLSTLIMWDAWVSEPPKNFPDHAKAAIIAECYCSCWQPETEAALEEILQSYEINGDVNTPVADEEE